MRTIVHLSDLHFGRVDATLVEPLVDAVHAAQPHVIVVSGDLTQRARRAQFRAARAFLDRLPAPRVVVPGNHDVPLWNVLARFARPLTEYRRWISADLDPFYCDDEIAVAGVNTARALTIKDGRINAAQARRIRERLCHLPPQVTRLLVTHHPFDLPDGDADVVGRARMAMRELAHCGVDLLLAGHFHEGVVTETAARYGHAALAVQAGTALSTRTRAEPNSFNVLRIAAGHVDIERMRWRGAPAGWTVAACERYDKRDGAWLPTA